MRPLVAAFAILLGAQARADDWSAWQRAYDPATRTRFIPVELWTGAPWDGSQQIHMAPADGNRVNMVFEARGNGATHLAVEVTGLENESAVGNATEGFCIVLCDLKTLLESGRSANLVRDRAELIAAS